MQDLSIDNAVINKWLRRAFERFVYENLIPFMSGRPGNPNYALRTAVAGKTLLGAGRDQPDEQGFVQSPSDPNSYLQKKEILKDVNLVLSEKRLNNLLRDHGAEIRRWRNSIPSGALLFRNE